MMDQQQLILDKFTEMENKLTKLEAEKKRLTERIEEKRRNKTQNQNEIKNDTTTQPTGSG